MRRLPLEGPPADPIQQTVLKTKWYHRWCFGRVGISAGPNKTKCRTQRRSRFLQAVGGGQSGRAWRTVEHSYKLSAAACSSRPLWIMAAYFGKKHSAQHLKREAHSPA